MKFEIDEELWYGISTDEKAEAQAAKSMAARMGRIVGTKPFPAAAQRLSQLTADPSCLMDEVVSVLESDPALCARLLRLVNSVGFSLRTACTSVRHAAALVGTEKLNQVASTAAILDMFESGSERAAELLEHATVVGALCRYLAFHFGLRPEELFTCGFLHDIGKLMMLETEGDDYLELLGDEAAEFDTIFIEERKRFGFDHAILAGHVLRAWNIPHPIPKVVAWHHHVTRAYAESTEISQMVSTLRLADAMSFALRRPDAQAQIEAVGRMEAASYMDISEGQLAAMWEEVGALTERARAVFRGDTLDEAEFFHSSRPSGESLRAVAKAKNSDRARGGMTSMGPTLSERPRQFLCVVCDAPSYAQRCVACHGYVCPLHVSHDDEWCELCQRSYEKAGIPQIRPVVSMLLGALCGGLLAAAFFGAASAGAQRPLRLMLGPTLILMLLGMLAGVGQRWVRRWWFLRTRPDRASFIPEMVESMLDTATRQSTTIVEIVTPSEPSPPTERLEGEKKSRPVQAEHPPELSLVEPEIPATPTVPDVDTSPASSLPLRAQPVRQRHWMSSSAHKPLSSAEETPDDRDDEDGPPPSDLGAVVLSDAPPPAPGAAAASIAPEPVRRDGDLEAVEPQLASHPAEPELALSEPSVVPLVGRSAVVVEAAPRTPTRPPPPMVFEAAPLTPARPPPTVRAVPAARKDEWPAPRLSAPPIEPAAAIELAAAVEPAASSQAPPHSAVVAIGQPDQQKLGGEPPRSGWSTVLDQHGTASGW